MHTVQHVHTNITWNAEHQVDVHTHRYHGFPELGEWHGRHTENDATLMRDLQRAVEKQLTTRTYHIGQTTRVATPEIRSMQVALHPLGYQVFVGIWYSFEDGGGFVDFLQFEIPDDFSEQWHGWMTDYHAAVRSKAGLDPHPAPGPWRHY